MALIPITVAPPVYRYGDSSIALPLFSADRIVTWSTSAGTLTSTISSATRLNAPNLSQTIIVTGTSGGDTGSMAITVWGTFPLQPNYGYDYELDDKTLISVAEDGSTVRRQKSGIKASWQLNMPNRPLTEYQTLRDFHAYHKKVIPFYYYDLAIGELRMVYFDSSLKVTVSGPDSISMSCLVREV